MWLLIIPVVLILAYYAKGKLLTYREVIKHYLSPVEKYSRLFDIPIPVIFGIIMQESGGNFLAVGSTGDYGLMQITQPALDDFNKRTGKRYTLQGILHDADANIEVGTSHLANYVKLEGDLFQAVRAYNRGTGAVTKENTVGFDYAKAVYQHKTRFEQELIA